MLASEVAVVKSHHGISVKCSRYRDTGPTDPSLVFNHSPVKVITFTLLQFTTSPQNVEYSAYPDQSLRNCVFGRFFDFRSPKGKTLLLLNAYPQTQLYLWISGKLVATSKGETINHPNHWLQIESHTSDNID